MPVTTKTIYKKEKKRKKEILLRQPDSHDEAWNLSAPGMIRESRFQREHRKFPGFFSWIVPFLLFLFPYPVAEHCTRIIQRSPSYPLPFRSFRLQPPLSTVSISISSTTCIHSILSPLHPHPPIVPRSLCPLQPTTYSNDSVCSLTYSHYLHKYYACISSWTVSLPLECSLEETLLYFSHRQQTRSVRLHQDSQHCRRSRSMH